MHSQSDVSRTCSVSLFVYRLGVERCDLRLVFLACPRALFIRYHRLHRPDHLRNQLGVSSPGTFTNVVLDTRFHLWPQIPVRIMTNRTTLSGYVGILLTQRPF